MIEPSNVDLGNTPDSVLEYLAALEQQNNELKAQIEQLRQGFSDLQSCHLNSEYNKTLSKIRVIFSATHQPSA